MKKIFVVGSLNMDLVIRAPFMPENGQTITGDGFMTNPGGKGANQATAVGKLGGNCFMVGCVGRDFGDTLIHTLNQYNVNTDFVVKRTEVSSGIAVIVVVDGDNRIILDKGSNALVDKKIIDDALSTANAGDYMVVQFEIENDMVEYALKCAKQKGMITVLNPAPAREISKECFTNCDYFMPNQSETQFFTDIYPEDEQTALSAVDALEKSGVKNVIITMGSKGALYKKDGKAILVPALNVNAIDTTAAGDTFVGAFVLGLSEEMTVGKAIEFAVKASAITVTRRGAQQSIPVRSEII